MPFIIKNYKNQYKIDLNTKNITKVCLCTVVKLENKYLIEFVEHYKNYSVDKIYLYDNNNINDETLEILLYKYIKKKYVIILNYRGKSRKQFEMYQDCYNQNFNIYDWIIFYDADEFINLKNYTNIKDFLNEHKFSKCQSIYLNWIFHSDNNLLYYNNRSLFKRFPNVIIKKTSLGKTIIRGNIKDIKVRSCHLIDYEIGRCDGFGKIFAPYNKVFYRPDYKYYYIDHFTYKSTEEFINKINKGDCIFGNLNNKSKIYRIKKYFKYNKMTLEKINLIENSTGLKIFNLMTNKKVKK